MSEINPSITRKIEAMDVPFVVQQFLKDLLDIEAKSIGDKSNAYSVVIDDYVKNQDINCWVQRSGE